MEPIVKHTGLVAPIDRSNIDTDAIIPKQFLREIKRKGFGVNLFHEWRYLDYDGTKENPDFILNKDPFRTATILLARDNFGCGSSREHAPWALEDFGIRVIIAPSFADIFYNNCQKNGILLVKLSTQEVDELFKQTITTPTGITLTADLERQVIIDPQKKEYHFDIPAFAKYCLVRGLDHIDWTLQFEREIAAYEKQIEQKTPWIAR